MFDVLMLLSLGPGEKIMKMRFGDVVLSMYICVEKMEYLLVHACRFGALITHRMVACEGNCG